MEKENLADLSQYHQGDFFDEVPLYSRFSDVSFLGNLDRDQADRFLLGFGIKFLKALIWYEIPRHSFFASLTVWNDPANDWIVPHVFVCCGKVKERLRNRLVLHPARSAPSKRICRLFSGLHLPDPLRILEDSLTSNELTRVHIGYKVSPYPKVVPIQTFERELSAIRGSK